jgi:predicted DNA-binding transcriptional regulator YafY
VLDTPSTPRTTPPFRETIFDAEAAPWRVQLAVSPSAEWLLDTYRCEVVTREPSLIIDLPVADLGWARQLVLRLGGTVSPLGPEELVDAVRHDAEQALRQYGVD